MEERSQSSIFGKEPFVKGERSDWGRTVKAVLISVLLTIGILAAYDRYFAQKIVALDVKGYIAKQRDLFLAGKINEDQLKNSFDRLERIKEKIPQKQGHHPGGRAGEEKCGRD